MKLEKFYITALNRIYYLHWTLDQGDTDYNINIYRSETQSKDLSEYEKIASLSSIDYTSYQDDVTSLDDLYRKWFYQLTSYNKSTGEETLLTTIAETKYYHLPDLASKMIMRQKELSLKKRSGDPFYLLIRRTWGVHCPICWDEVLQRATDPDCPVCLGTGWVNGFFKPIKFLASTNSAPKYNQIQTFELWKGGDIIIYTLNYPLIKPQDVIIDNIGNRWSVVQINPIRKHNIILEQQIHATLLQPDDIAYSIQVDDFNSSDLKNDTLYKS
jgi:hypothetical protein